MRLIPQGYAKVRDPTLGVTSLGQNLKAAEAESQAELSPSRKPGQAPHGLGRATCSSKMGYWCPAELGGAGEHCVGHQVPSTCTSWCLSTYLGSAVEQDAHGGHREGGGKVGGAIPLLFPGILMGDF